MTEERADAAIARLGLAPHPFEGWCRPGPPEGGGHWSAVLLAADTPMPWHRLRGRSRLRYAEGAPATLSLSDDGHRARAHLLGPAHRAEVTVEPGTFLTLETLGRWTLFDQWLEADLTLADRDLCPEDWFPAVPR